MGLMTRLGRRTDRVTVDLSCGEAAEVLALLDHYLLKGLAALDSGVWNLSRGWVAYWR